jgi:LiaF transmembrane domain
MDMTGSPAPGGQNTTQIVVGLIILGMGAVLLLDRYSDVRHIRSWWPLVPILMGVVRLTNTHPQPRRRAGIRRSGVWFIMIGVWAFVSDSHLFGFTYGTSWPLLIIGAGVLMVWGALECGGRRPLRREP